MKSQVGMTSQYDMTSQVDVTDVKPMKLFINSSEQEKGVGQPSMVDRGLSAQHDGLARTEDDSEKDEQLNQFGGTDVEVKVEADSPTSDSDSDASTSEYDESLMSDIGNKTLSEAEQRHLEMHRLIQKKCPQPYACGECRARYSSAKRLEFHKLEHKIKNGIYQCEKCGSNFKTAKRLFLHDENVHSEKSKKWPTLSYGCEECKCRYSSAKRLEFHKLKHKTRDGIYECEKCGGNFETTERLYQHDKNMHSEERKKRLPLSYSCKECKFRCSEANRLEFPKLEHKTTSGIYQCDKCDRAFKNTYTLYMHDYHIHTESAKQFACSKCEYRTYTIQNLRLHELRHTLTCPKCNECFADFKDLNKHMTEQHSTRSCLHVCSECGESYPTKSLLKFHEAKHATKAGIKSFLCNRCGKGFTSDIALRQHVSRVHKEKKKHQCNTCGQLFKEKNALRRHQVQHFDELKHVCDLCGKTYNRLHTLSLHMATHSGSKSHKCQHCGNSYYTNEHLQKHINRCHTDKCTTEGVLICTACGKTYRNNYMLREHMISHSTDRPHLCKICGRSFKSMRNLREHERRHNTETFSRDFQCQKCYRRFKLKKHLNVHMKTIHCPEDERSEYLRQRRDRNELVRQRRDRAKKQSKPLGKIINDGSSEEETYCGPMSHELNPVTPRQTKLKEQNQTQTKMNTNMTTESQPSLSDCCDERGTDIDRPTIDEYSEDDSHHIEVNEENIATNQLSNLLGEDVDNENNLDRTVISGNGRDVLLPKGIQSKFDPSEDHEYFYKEPVQSTLLENSTLGKFKENLNEVFDSTISSNCNNDLVSKTLDIFNQSTINKDLDNVDSAIVVGSKDMFSQNNELFQVHVGISNTDGKFLQTFESDVLNQSKQEIAQVSNHDKRKKLDMLESNAEMRAVTDKPLDKTSTKLQQIFKCETCSIKFRLQETLVMHMVHVHDVDERKAKGLSSH